MSSTLKNIIAEPSPWHKLQLARQLLPNIGTGVMRAVFKLDEKTVLKLPLNPKGLAANQKEIILSKPENQCWVGQILDGRWDEPSWLVMEYLPDINPQHLIGTNCPDFSFFKKKLSPFSGVRALNLANPWIKGMKEFVDSNGVEPGELTYNNMGFSHRANSVLIRDYGGFGAHDNVSRVAYARPI